VTTFFLQQISPNPAIACPTTRFHVGRYPMLTPRAPPGPPYGRHVHAATCSPQPVRRGFASSLVLLSHGHFSDGCGTSSSVGPILVELIRILLLLFPRAPSCHPSLRHQRCSTDAPSLRLVYWCVQTSSGIKYFLRIAPNATLRNLASSTPLRR
jgi:hypothetical protein